MEKIKHIGFRIEAETLRKFQYVAKYDDRSTNGQMMYLINTAIREFEAKHGTIILPADDSNATD